MTAFLRFIAIVLLAVRPAAAQPSEPFSFAPTYAAAHARGQLVGSAVVVQRDGRTVLAEGFGVADVATNAPMAPESTAFRATSVTKAVTAMAVLTLAHTGRLDLDADVSRYLDFPLRDAFAQPMRVRDLLTHTAGFEEASRDFYMPVGTTLADYVRTHQPARLWPPGRTVSYSNYGYALAGRIVEIASGRPFEDYVESALFAPLGLRHATVRKPHPAPALAALAPEYGAGRIREPLRYLPDVPAGGLVATPHELARLFSAALFPSGGARVIPESAARAMLAQQSTLHPLLDGVTFGLRETRFRGRRVLYTGGDSCCHHTDVYVVPDERLVYVHSYSGTDRRFRGEMWRAFATAHLEPADVAAPAPGTAPAPGNIAGRYLLTRRAERSMFALFYRFTNEIAVEVDADGTVTIPALFVAPDGAPRRYAPLGGGVYEEPEHRQRIAFLAAADGRVERLAGGGIVEAHRVRGADARTLGALLAGSLAVMLLTVIGALAALVRRRTSAPALRTQRRAALVAALATVAFVLVFAGFAALAQQDLGLLSADYDWVLRIAQGLALLALAAGAVTIAATMRAWRASTALRRVWMLAQCAALGVIAWLVLAHHVLQRAITY